MTREEAIRILENTFQDAYVYKYYDSVTHQAINMAIEALSVPTDGDLISRADAIAELKEKDPSALWDTADIEVWVNALPSADRPRGEWIKEQFVTFVYKCPICGHEMLSDDSEIYYCSNCGADMRGERNG